MAALKSSTAFHQSQDKVETSQFGLQGPLGPILLPLWPHLWSFSFHTLHSNNCNLCAQFAHALSRLHMFILL